MRKSEMLRSYAPDFVSVETLAYRLNCSVRTVELYSRTNLLPRPVTIGNLVRWRWTEVEDHIAQQNGSPLSIGDADGNCTNDEYSSAIRRLAPRSEKKAAND